MLARITLLLTPVLGWTLLIGAPAASGGAVLEEAPRVGYLAPRFKLPGPDGTQASLADFRGRVVLVNFWATWCAPCLKEMPDLAELQAAFPVTQFTVIGVNEDGKLEPVLAFLRTHPLNFPIFLDDGMRVMRHYGVRGLPATFLIDGEGVVLEIILGPREWSSQAWRQRIAELIGPLAGDDADESAAPAAEAPAN